jgi:hypothetical protein
VDDSRNSQSHFRVGIWLVLCRCSHGDGAGCHLSLADTQAIPLVPTNALASINEFAGTNRQFGSEATGTLDRVEQIQRNFELMKR